MKFPFDSDKGLVVVDVAILGTNNDAILRLCLDTGAERTVFNKKVIKEIGLEPENDGQLYPLKSAGGEISAPLVVLPKIFALGGLKENFPVYVHTLPKDARVDGLLGLDFLRGHVLTLDFKTGEISFE